jgi:hypothetical protein
MVLIPTTLAHSLETHWLPGDGGPWHDSSQASADAFAGAVANWFQSAQAAGLPCMTALARRSQLMGQAMSAIGAQDAQAAGEQLALAFMAYVAGQSFSTGVAAPPAATGAGATMIGNALATRELPQAARAHMIATALHVMALSSIVSFPTPPFAAPIT